MATSRLNNPQAFGYSKAASQIAKILTSLIGGLTYNIKPGPWVVIMFKRAHTQVTQQIKPFHIYPSTYPYKTLCSRTYRVMTPCCSPT